MRPGGYTLSYRSNGRITTVELEGFDELETQHLAVTARTEGATCSFAVKAKANLDLVSLRIRYIHDFARDERICCNGYQSWTDTGLLAPNERMRGLDAVPRFVVKKYALDGSGDYRFTSYDPRPGHFHGWTYAVLKNADLHTLVASLDESHGFTRIDVSCDEGHLDLVPELPARPIESGEELCLTRHIVTNGSEDEVYDRWFFESGIVAREAAPLIGYTSWYRHYENIDAETLLLDLASAARELARVGETGLSRVFQIDDGYTKVGDWLSPNEKDFPNGMAELAEAATGTGLVPGLWLAPFVCERKSRLYREHPEWLLRDTGGQAVTTGCHWSGGFALDTQNPEFREHIQGVLRTVTRDWGFRLLKLDFLYAACMLPHAGLNRGELMHDAIDLIREACGDDVLLLGCGVPLAAAFGKFDYCRIGCDVGLDWDDKPPMRLLNRERVSTKNSLANTVSREPLDGRAFMNDPDVFFLRDDVKLNEKQRRQVLMTDANHASMLLSSDDMGEWDKTDRLLFESAAKMLAQRHAERAKKRNESKGQDR